MGIWMLPNAIDWAICSIIGTEGYGSINHDFAMSFEQYGDKSFPLHHWEKDIKIPSVRLKELDEGMPPTAID